MSSIATPTYLPGLALRLPDGAVPAVSDYKPESWPPQDDFVVVRAADGTPVSRFSDSFWDLSPWHGGALKLAFNDGEKLRVGQRPLSTENGRLLRTIAAWFLFGPGAVTRPRTLIGNIRPLKPLLAFCSKKGILASDLYRHPRVVDEYIERCRGKDYEAVGVGVFHWLWNARDGIGFTLFSHDQIKALVAATKPRESVQHAYIPPRIWSYQNIRLRECIDDFLAHAESVSACVDMCFDAYVANAGSVEGAFYPISSPRSPMHGRKFCSASTIAAEGLIFFDGAQDALSRHGIEGLVEKWVGTEVSITCLSKYLSLVSYAGIIYIANFSLMRVNEAMDIPYECWSVERDGLGDDVCLIRSVTTKTIDDDQASWIVSPSAKVAVDALRRVFDIRQKIAKQSPHCCEEELNDRRLLTRSREPWASKRADKYKGKLLTSTYAYIIKRFSKLFDDEQLKVTDEDMRISRAVNGSSLSEAFSVGQVWPLGWHQLRRTGAVNMLASGLVKEADLSYQLKHANRMMSRYYANNYRHLQAAISPHARAAYVAEKYLVLGVKASALLSDRHGSPHGDKRKNQLLNLISESSHEERVALAKKGRIAYHETFLGACTKPGEACPLGGISNISSCMGFGDNKPCEYVVVDSGKKPEIVELVHVLRDQLQPEQKGRMLNAALQSQIESAERALEVIDRGQ